MTTWTPKTQQSETWTAETKAVRVFDPDVFDRNPIFDTGSSAGLWDAKTEQQEVWTAA
jgi:hypothetical protein